MLNVRKLSIIWIKFLQPRAYTSKTLLSVECECSECGWSLVRLELELLLCSFLGLAAGALQPFVGKPNQLCLCAPLVLGAEPALWAGAQLWAPSLHGPGSARALLPSISSPAVPWLWGCSQALTDQALRGP